MTVPGARGSISGNYVIEKAGLLITIGTRFVCRSDCSRNGFTSARYDINTNADIDAVRHFGKTTTFLGDAKITVERLNQRQVKAIGNSGDGHLRSGLLWIKSDGVIGSILQVVCGHLVRKPNDFAA